VTSTTHHVPRVEAPGIVRTAVRAGPGPRRLVALFGPAFVAGLAYVDPGNVATNFAAGSKFGYQLVWVVVLANVAAMLIQYLAAKLGLATGDDLAGVTRERCPRPVVIVLWLQAELVAVATDLAEVVGGAIGLQLLFGLPLVAGSAVTAAAALVLLALRDSGHRRFEAGLTALFAVIALGFGLLAVRAGPSPLATAHGLLPDLGGNGALVLASAMIGATVMPHALYVHSALVADRSRAGKPLRRGAALRAQRRDIGVAMGIAGLVNLSMVVIAAAALGSGSDDLVQVHGELIRTLGGTAGFVFAVALLTSGLASSGVGTYAGEVIMAGYLRRRIPRWVRRAVTLTPVLAVLALGIPATTALIASQVVLSLGIPFALGSLVAATASRRAMGSFVNRPTTTALTVLITAAIVAMNAVLVCRL
jgi:manganese transport protein